MAGILFLTGSSLDRAWSHLLEASASDYWYWDGTEVWDSNVTTGSNLAVIEAEAALAGMGNPDGTGPTVFVPQREPYNPGGFEFGGTVEASDFEVWTLVDDLSGLASVSLKWRVDVDGVNPIASIQNETFVGGAEVGAWNSEAMSGAVVPTPAQSGSSLRKAMRYGAMITGQEDVLIDYYVQAVDSNGHVTNSDIQHVWVGVGGGSGGAGVVINPDPAQAGEIVAVSYDSTGTVLSGADPVWIHYGFDNWGTVLPDAAMDDGDGDGVWEISFGIPASAIQLDVVFNDGAGTWDNNNGNDWHFTVEGGDPGAGFVIDGVLDASATLVGSNNGINLWAGLDGDTLYVACTPAGGGEDRFLVLADEPGLMGGAMWAKNGQIAGWDAFIGNENDNNWSGWFGHAGAAEVASGAVLEGTLNIGVEFGLLPETVHLGVLSFGSGDGATLNMTNQVGVTLDGDGNFEAEEYVEVALCTLGDGGCCPADLNGDGSLDFFDVSAFLTAFGNEESIADWNGDGAFDFFDVSGFLASFGAGCP